MHEHQSDDPEILSEIEKLGYDPRDVPVEQTKKHAIALFLSCGVMMLLAYGVMALIDRLEGSKSTGQQPLPERRVQPEDPYPLLQSNRGAKQDIHDLRAVEAAKTDTAGWVDQGKGVARIPVSVAIEKVLSEGIRSGRTQAAPQSVTGEDPAAPGTTVPNSRGQMGDTVN
jgi:hypothetical protein